MEMGILKGALFEKFHFEMSFPNEITGTYRHNQLKKNTLTTLGVNSTNVFRIMNL